MELDAAGPAVADQPPTCRQLRGARAMLGWSLIDLAKAARLSVATVRRMETVRSRQESASMRAKVRAALEAAGVRFSFDGERENLSLAPNPEPWGRQGDLESILNLSQRLR